MDRQRGGGRETEGRRAVGSERGRRCGDHVK